MALGEVSRPFDRVPGAFCRTRFALGRDAKS